MKSLVPNYNKKNLPLINEKVKDWQYRVKIAANLTPRMRKPKDITTIKLEDVKGSDCGCCNCLWASIECKNYEKFQPK